MSRLLSTDGKNIEGLTKFGEIEKSRRKRLQQKMREFTADIEGKFDFLNDLNKDLRKKFDDSFGLVEDKFDNAEKLLNEKVDLCINKLSQSQNDFISQSKEDISQALKALAKKREDDTMEMHKEQKESLEKIDKLVNESLAKTEEKSDALVKSQEEFISQSKEQSNDFMANQNTLLKEMKKQLKIYKTISIIALAVSIVSILYGIIL